MLFVRAVHTSPLGFITIDFVLLVSPSCNFVKSHNEAAYIANITIIIIITTTIIID